MKTLDLRGNILSEESCRAIAGMLSKNECVLKKLILEQTGMTNRGLEVLCRTGLAQCRSLRKLVLRDNQFTDCRPLRHAIHVEHLDLSDNAIMGDEGAERLKELLQRSRKLRHLEMEACQLTSATLDNLSRALSLSSVRHLNLSFNNLRGVSDWSFCCTQLHTLQLASCGWKDADLEGLEQCIGSHSHSQLVHLDLQHCAIGRSQTVAHLLRSCRSLQHLNLQFNPLQDCAAAVADALRDHQHSLISLKLVHPFQKKSRNHDSHTSSHHHHHDEMIEHWMLLNRAGRALMLREARTHDEKQWPSILERADQVYGVNALYYALRQSPHWIQSIARD